MTQNGAFTEAWFMRRAVVTAVFLCAVAALGGCPIYNHEDQGCYRDRDCAPDYLCDMRSGLCYVPGAGNSCLRPTDCVMNQTCGRTGQCLSGDCTFNGCVAGYQCDSSTGKCERLPNSTATEGPAPSTSPPRPTP